MAKKYVITGAYVTVKTMTAEGMRLVGMYAGAPVPADADQAWIDHHLAENLIVEVQDPAAVDPSVTPIEAQEGISGADKVREQEKALNRQRGSAKAAETRKDNEDAEAKAKADAEAADKAKAAADKMGGGSQVTTQTTTTTKASDAPGARPVPPRAPGSK